ncbi:MAG: hypothetical protein WC974_09500, partial [Thermoplasmata archaeon]
GLMKTIFKKGIVSITIPTFLTLGTFLAGSILWINSQFVSSNDKIALEKNTNIAQQKDIDGIREDLTEIKDGIKEIKKALYIVDKTPNTDNKLNGFTTK